MADIYEAIADPNRRHMLDALLKSKLTGGEGEMTVSELVEHTQMGQPTVSKHLKVLREANLVTSREEGQKRFYSVTPDALEEVEDWVVPFLSLDFEVNAEEILSERLGDAGEQLGQWLTKGAGWLKDKVGDRVQVDFDPKQAGKDLGRRLAEGKSEAEKQAKDLEAKAKSKVEEVSKEVKSEVDHFTEEVKKRVNRGSK